MVNLRSYKYSEDFLSEETRCNFHIDTKRKEIWAVELDLLFKFDAICKEYNLSYFAEAGTLLGAIRHGGFVPWDDDIDVVMPRKDYNKLKNIASKVFEYPYFWQDEYSDPGSLRNNHAQLRNSETTAILYSEYEAKYHFNQGIFLDIFPLDNVPPIEERKEFWDKINELKHRMFHSAAIERSYVVPNQDYVQIDKIIQKYNEQETKLWGMISYSVDKRHNIRRKEDYEEKKIVPFENLEIRVPVGYENVLRRIYGIWREFDPNTSAHGEIFFDTDKSYKCYIGDQL